MSDACHTQDLAYRPMPMRKAPAARKADFLSDDVGEVRKFLAHILGGCDFQGLPSGTEPRLELLYVGFERTGLFRLNVADACEFSVRLPRHLLCLCEAGESRFSDGCVSLRIADTQAAVLPAPVRGRFSLSPGTSLIGVVLSDADFRREAAAVLRGVSTARLGMLRGFDASVNPGRVFRNAVLLLLDDLAGTHASRNNVSIRMLFDRLIVFAILQMSGAEAMDLADGGHAQVTPRHVKRAEEYIKSHLSEPLDNTLLARVSQASPRSLYRGFVQFRGVTPARYVQELRLETAHRLLTSGDGIREIGEIAAETGFRSYASFWRSYVRKFGVSPSHSRPSRDPDDRFGR